MIRFDTAAKALMMVAAATLPACQSGGLDGTRSAPLDTDNQKASYSIGFQIGTSLVPGVDSLQMEQLVRGLQDGIQSDSPAIAQEEMQTILQQFTMMVQQQQQAARTEAAEANRTEGETFLAENATKEGVQTTASGLQYEVLREGEGPRPGPDDRVTINYRGTLIDGTQFDSSYDRGEPATFNVGGVIQGFSEGLQLMPVGSHYRFWIPGDLGYGERGSGETIGPNATLIFEVELLEIPE